MPSSRKRQWSPSSAEVAEVLAKAPRRKRSSKPEDRPLPAWYYRIKDIIKPEYEDSFLDDWSQSESEEEQFDEDLSELNEDDRKHDEDCSDWEDCCCLDEDDAASKRSYDGSDADDYYELKWRRRRRKLDLEEQRIAGYESKKKQKALEANMEKEVRKVYRGLKKAIKAGEEMPDLDLGARWEGHFNLFSVDHVEYCFDADLYPTKYVEFYCLDKGSPELHGHVYFNSSEGCDFGPFLPPKKIGRKKYKLKTYQGSKISFRFIGRDNIIVKLDQQIAFGKQPPHPSAPKQFKLMGVKEDYSQQRRMLKLLRGGGPSPPPETSVTDMSTLRGPRT